MAFVPFVFHERALLPHTEGVRIVEAALDFMPWPVLVCGIRAKGEAAL